MRDAEQVISEVIKAEGGYVDHPDDRGGPTNFGITLATLAEFRGRSVTAAEVKAMTEEEARRIYRDRYVVKPGFDKVAELSPAIAAELVDTGVNMGPGVPAVFLQRCLNALNLKGQHFADLKADGDIGPATIGALRLFLGRRGERGERVICKALNCLQGARYIALAETREANESFVFGWLEKRVGL